MNEKQLTPIYSSEFTDDKIDIQVAAEQWQIIQHYGSETHIYCILWLL